MDFKGTKGKLELKFVSGICIGIGTKDLVSQMTANTLINHIKSDKQYKKEKEEIEANMLIYSKAPELFEELKHALKLLKCVTSSATGPAIERIEKLLKESVN